MTARPATMTSLVELAAAGLIDEVDVTALAPVAERFAIAVPPAIATLIARGAPDDPIARQFLPDRRELDTRPHELADPIGDASRTTTPGLVHRYLDRVLLKIVAVCPVYCRFCFRREMIGPGRPAMLDAEDLDRALAYVASRPEINEVIITGGDPLVLSPRRITALTARIAAIAHVTKLRWHTRVPVVTPERIDRDLIDALAAPGRTVRLAIHCNHPRELTPAARNACANLIAAGCELLSQTVLLKGINDDPATLALLLRGFTAAGIRPYYLHHGDLAPGTAHFRTTIAEGRAIMRRLAAMSADEDLPTYVLDIPGGHGKVAIMGDHVQEQSDGSYMVMAPDGTHHHYRDVTA